MTAALGTQSFNVIAQAQYAPFGPALGWVYGNGLVLERTLDPDYRLLSQQTLPVQSLGFSYDAAGNLLAIDDGVDPGLSQAFGYDAADRLVSASGVYGTRAYGYDALGNRLSRTADGQTDSYQYAAAANRLELVAGPNAEAFSYDAAGNTVARGAFTFGYNAANRLASVSASGQPLASYGYNARGERVSKTAGGVTRHFHYDLEGNLLGEHEAGGALRRAYVYVAGERVALLQAADAGPSGLFFVHNDHLGTPKAVTDAAQNIVWAAAHTPFGTALVSVNQVENRFRFPGQYFDQETGLNYNYFRDYDPSIGRYVESDPIGLTGGTNTYAYAGGNPIANVDPTGLFLPALAIPVVEGFINTVGAIVILANSGIFSGDDPGDVIPFPDPNRDSDADDDQCPPNDETDDDDGCIYWYRELLKIYQGILQGRENTDDLTKQAYNNSARRYNRICGSMGYPRLPLFTI